MDGLLGKVSGMAQNAMSGQQTQQQQQPTAEGTQQNVQQTGVQGEDYGDKGLDMVEKKLGLNSSSMRGINENITDRAREAIESATGKDIPDKFSN